MKIVSIINMAIAFVLELIGLLSFGYLGTLVSKSFFVKAIGAAICIGFVGFVWAQYFAPKAEFRLSMPWLMIGKFTLLLVPSIIMYFRRESTWAISWAIIVTIHLVLSAIMKEL